MAKGTTKRYVSAGSGKNNASFELRFPSSKPNPSHRDKDKYASVANGYADGVVDLWKQRRDLSGLAWIAEDNSKVIEAPRPITPDSLYIFLHETAHHKLGHTEDESGSKPYQLEELEATRAAFKVMHDNGVPVPDRLTKAALYNIRHAVKSDAKKGVSELPEVRAYVSGKGPAIVAMNPVAPRVQRSIDAASRWAELAAYSEYDAGRKYASVQKHFSDWARMSGNAATLEHFTAGERQRVKLAFAKAYAAEEKAAAGKQASNPAKSAAQYRLAQAVIGGTSTSSMPVAVAREIVKRNPPQTKYTVPELRALFYRLGYGMGKGDSASAAVGVDIKGDQEANFRFNLDKIIEYYQPVSEEQIVNLRGVFQVGYGHGYSGRPSVEKQFKSGKKKNPAKRTRKNPMDDADAMFESFHGEPPTETVEFVDELHVHHNLAACGDLVGFKIRTVSGYDATVEFSGVILCTSESGTQMHLRGGDQELDLEALHVPEAGKESVIVGQAWAVAYETEKDFDKFEEIQYVHLLGDEKFYKGVKQGKDLWNDAKPPKEGAFTNGNLPSLRYSVIDQMVYLDGGVYKIERPLMGTSPGIEG